MSEFHVYLDRKPGFMRRTRDCDCQHKDIRPPLVVGGPHPKDQPALTVGGRGTRPEARRISQEGPGPAPRHDQNLRPERVAASQRALAEMEPEAAQRAVRKAEATGRSYPTSGQRERSEGDQIGHEFRSWVTKKLQGKDQSTVANLRQALMEFLAEEEAEEEHEGEDQSYEEELERYRREGGSKEAAERLKPHNLLTGDAYSVQFREVTRGQIFKTQRFGGNFVKISENQGQNRATNEIKRFAPDDIVQVDV